LLGWPRRGGAEGSGGEGEMARRGALELDGVLMREGDEEIFAVSHGLEAQINSPNKTPGPLMFSQPFFYFFTVAIKN